FILLSRLRSSLSFNHAFITLILPQSLNPPFRRSSFMVTKPSKWSSPVTVEFVGLDNAGKITLFHMFKDEGRDLSPITDKLWKKFFEKQFGTNSTNEVVTRMKENKVSFKWIQLYEAKGKEMTQVENEALDRIKQLYKKEDANNGPGYNVANVKSNIMKKAKIEFMKRVYLAVIKDFTGSKEKHAPILETEDSKESIQKLSAIFSTENFPCDADNNDNLTVDEDNLELNIDDIDLDDHDGKRKDQGILGGFNKKKLPAKFQALKG
ncbi:hypothetical protein V8G54_020442, partial [Vigna mungo]